MNAKNWRGLICGWLYNEAAGALGRGIMLRAPASWSGPGWSVIKPDFERLEV